MSVTGGGNLYPNWLGSASLSIPNNQIVVSGKTVNVVPVIDLVNHGVTSVTANILNVTSKFGFGGSTPVTRFESVNATSINTITTVTWSPIRVCSGGTAVTRWFLIGSATANAPSFLGYDEEVRKITRQVVHILSQNYFGFVNAVSLTYP